MLITAIVLVICTPKPTKIVPRDNQILFQTVLLLLRRSSPVQSLAVRVAYRYSGTDGNQDSFRKVPVFYRFRVPVQ